MGLFVRILTAQANGSRPYVPEDDRKFLGNVPILGLHFPPSLSLQQVSSTHYGLVG